MYRRFKASRAAMFAALISSAPSVVLAACYPSACDEVPKDILVWRDGTVSVYFNSNVSALDCTPRTDQGVQINSSDNGRDGMLSTLISTKLANRNAYVRIVNGSSPCEVLYVGLRD